MLDKGPWSAKQARCQARRPNSPASKPLRERVLARERVAGRPPPTATLCSPDKSCHETASNGAGNARRSGPQPRAQRLDRGFAVEAAGFDEDAVGLAPGRGRPDHVEPRHVGLEAPLVVDRLERGLVDA